MAEALATPHTHEQAQLAAPYKSETQLTIIWRRFRKHKAGLVGIIVLLLLTASSIVVPMLSTFDLYEVNPAQRYAIFGEEDILVGGTHWLGTDWLGRDYMTRLFFAGRTSLFVALLSTVMMVIIGSVFGGVAGYYGGWVDTLLMRFTDFLLALPLLPLFLFALRFLRESPALRTMWQAQETNTFITIAAISGVFTLFGWMGLARLVRGSVLSLRTQTYVEASRALGVSNRRIIFRHLLPNTIAPILVSATFAVGDFIILESVLAYFNQGINDPPLPSWGNMIVASQSLAFGITELNPFANVRGWIFLLPGFMVVAAVLSINYIGDALRSALDPHQG
jgi:peptide/nickel transport system permease protein